MSKVEAAGAVNAVWIETLASYKKDLSRKDLLVVEANTSPTDVVNHIKSLEAKTHAGKSGAFADRIYAITGRLTQFSNVIGAITSSNTEASLVWGSLKFLLTIVHKSSEEYEKICQSILAVGDFFAVVDLVSETFNSSELVCGHVVGFYTSVLTFWSKALIFYKRRRFYNIFRVLWHDFESEFGDLDREMKRYRKLIEKAAGAVHMNESRIARFEQTKFHHELLDARQSGQKSDRHRDIVSWLAPTNHEANYFVDDLRSAFELCHPGTCTWILDKPEFNTWRDKGPDSAVTKLLWLTGVPGAGKTVLSSFVINKLTAASSERSSPPILHFFFKLTDSDKNSVLAVTRSLLYQLYSLFPATLSTEILALRDNSGKERALSEQGLWDLFVKYTNEVANLIIVLDALDECNGVDVLLSRLLSLLQGCCARVFVASRKEEHIALALAGYPQIVVCHEDVEADIHSYVTKEIEEIPRFRGKAVQYRMIDALSSGHGGMFLWAYLMVKELKELGTVRQVDNALKSLPSGLEEMHEAIITRLDSTLHKAHRELVTKILKWIVCAVRPLRLPELQEILRFESRQGTTEGHSLDHGSDDDDFLYSEKDIELACGALVMSRNGTLQLIHLSTREILTRRPPRMGSDDSRLGFYVSTHRENPRMAALCVSYIDTHLAGIDSVSRPGLETASRLQFSQKSYDSTELVTTSPFIDYAGVSWQAHLIDGKISLELKDVMLSLQTLLTYDLTIKWIELCICLHQDMALTLEHSCNKVTLWAGNALLSKSPCHQAIGFLCAWSRAVVSVISDYARVIEEFPSEIHYLDLEELFSGKCSSGPAILPTSYASAQGRKLRERISQIRAIDISQPKAKVEPCRQLQPNLQDPSMNQRLGFLLYDGTRNVYFSAEPKISDGTEVLRAQERATGRKLLPVKSAMHVSHFLRKDSDSLRPIPFLYVMGAVLCPAHKYLAILYCDKEGCFITSSWIIERHLDFQGIRDVRPWARRLYYVESRNSSFLDSCLPLTVGQDGLFYCPSGQMHPERGICRRIPDRFDASAQNERQTNRVTLAFSGNGQTLVRLDPIRGILDRISWLKSPIPDPLHWALLADSPQISSVRMRAISQTARFGVYDIQLVNGYWNVFYVLDSEANQQKLRIQVQNEFFPISFYFSRDERYLSSIDQIEHNLTHFSSWAVTDPSFAPQADTSLFIPGFGYGQMNIRNSIDLNFDFRPTSNICVVEEDSKIILVNGDRELYELDLKSMTFSEGTFSPSQSRESPHELYCQIRYNFSKKGHCLVASYINCPQTFDSSKARLGDEQSESQNLKKTRIELRFVELSNIAEQMQKIELDYLESELPISHWHYINFSPDLSMVRAGRQIFDLQASNYPPMSIPDSLFSQLGYENYSEISFSACNDYLIAYTIDVESGNFQLFKICRTTRTIEKLATNGLEDLVDDIGHAEFHPMLPLLLLTGSVYRGSDMKEEMQTIKVVQFDLREPDPDPLVIFEKVIEWPRSLWYRAQYSNCGSFPFVTLADGILLLMNSILTEQNQAKMLMPAVWTDRRSYNTRFYEVGCRKTNIPMVFLYQAIERTHPDGLRDSTYVRRDPEYTITVPITAIPNHLISAEPSLLVPENEDDFVRVLFLPRHGGKDCPPTIKRLRVTMKEILAKVDEAARAVEARLDVLSREELAEVFGGRWSEAESEGVVLSADDTDLMEIQRRRWEVGEAGLDWIGKRDWGGCADGFS